MRKTQRYDGIDFTGYRHERLLVIRKADFGRTQWVCKCDCGKEVTFPISRILEYKSCGCLEKENKKHLSDHTKTHGMTNTILYSKYCGMKERCYNKNYSHYERYGGRGIKMCEEWKNSFESFRDWAYKNGYDESKKWYEQSLDRIDNNGNYEPNNCRWADQKTQGRNKENSVFLNYNGEKINLSEFAERFNISYASFITRNLKRGKKLEEIVEEWNMAYNTPSDYVRMEEACKIYNVCPITMRKMIRKGIVSGVKACNKWFVHIESEEMIKVRKQK